MLGEEYRELSYLIIATFWGVSLPVCMKLVLSVCAGTAAKMQLQAFVPVQAPFFFLTGVSFCNMNWSFFRIPTVSVTSPYVS